jgi:formylglycine-generating enzyme required for sulfatase activity
VSLREAKLYCKFRGKRLPQEWEWQYAAQGTDNRKYPWGDAACPSGKQCQPKVHIQVMAIRIKVHFITHRFKT